MGRNSLMPFCFKYSDGKIIEKWFDSSRRARDYAYLDGDHCIDWWAGKLKKGE